MTPADFDPFIFHVPADPSCPAAVIPLDVLRRQAREVPISDNYLTFTDNVGGAETISTVSTSR